jgi:hypothetical protein
VITNEFLATSAASTGSLGVQLLTSFLVALVGGVAASLLAWVGLLNKIVEKRIDDKIESRRAMWGKLMESDKFEHLQRITSVAYIARNAARDFVQAHDRSEQQAQLDEFRMAAKSYQKSIMEDRYLLESVVGAFTEAHDLKNAMLAFNNATKMTTTGADSAEIGERYEALNIQFEKFNSAARQWFPRPEGTHKP